MKLASFKAIVGALEGAGVRFLVAGGLAVSAHGDLRFTKDVDLVVPLLPEMNESAGRPQDKIDIEYLRIRLEQDGQKRD